MPQPPLCLVLFSGLPGCGKTTLAHRMATELHIPLFTKDRLQSALRSQGLAERSGPEGYLLMLDQAEAQLSLNTSVILDAVFPMEGFRRKAEGIAVRYRARFLPIYCYCSDERLWLARISQREQLVPDWTPVGWEEVLRLRGEFQPWAVEKALFLDAVHSVEDNLAKAMQKVVLQGSSEEMREQ